MVDVGGPSGPVGLDLNKSIEIDTYKTPPRISLSQKINVEQIPPQKLTTRTKNMISSNVSRWKAIQKTKKTHYTTEEIVFKRLDEIAQTFLKTEETRSQTILKFEANQADREFAMMEFKLKIQEMIAKEKRDSDERIVAHNINFPL